MAKATIVGENHASLKDAKKFEAMVESKKFDAIFLENREDRIYDESVNPNFFYAFYLIGLAELLALLAPLYTSKVDVYDAAEKLGIPVIDTIDAPFPIIFTMTNVWIRRILPLLLIVLSMVVFLFVYWITGLLLLIVSPFFHFCILAFNPKRNEFMANSIAEKIKTNNYKNVLVGCGKRHVKGIAKSLRRVGIEVDTGSKVIRTEPANV